MKVVIDTNVLVSGILNDNGMPGQIINLLINGRITPLYDNRILQEYEEVLNRSKFGFNDKLIAPIMDYIKNEGEYIAAEPIEETFKDIDDKMFYEVALTGNAICIITGNKSHYPKKDSIKNPKEFIDLYFKMKE